VTGPVCIELGQLLHESQHGVHDRKALYRHMFEAAAARVAESL